MQDVFIDELFQQFTDALPFVTFSSIHRRSGKESSRADELLAERNLVVFIKHEFFVAIINIQLGDAIFAGGVVAESSPMIWKYQLIISVQRSSPLRSRMHRTHRSRISRYSAARLRSEKIQVIHVLEPPADTAKLKSGMNLGAKIARLLEQSGLLYSYS